MILLDVQCLARQHLEHELPGRWGHVQAVAAVASRFVKSFSRSDLAVRAAWLHDIGYASSMVDTGFHPIDGARALRRWGWQDDVVGLVAHHSVAVIEAGARGLADQLGREFADVESVDRDILWVADATTGPDGSAVTIADRVADVIARYGADSLVARSMRQAEPHLRAASRRLA